MDIPPEIIVSAERLALTGSTAVIHRPFRAGRLVRLRRGYYVKTSTWVEATPAQRFEWSAAAVGLAFEQSVFCGESAAVVLGVPTLRPRSSSIWPLPRSGPPDGGRQRLWFTERACSPKRRGTQATIPCVTSFDATLRQWFPAGFPAPVRCRRPWTSCVPRPSAGRWL